MLMRNLPDPASNTFFRFSKFESVYLGICCLSGLIAIVLLIAGRGPLWEDEIIAVTHANQPLPFFFIEVLRNDIHPPLYFLQLMAWLSISNSDHWAYANSLFFGALSAGALWWVARKTFSTRSASLALALLLVLPTFVCSTSNVRMYSMLPGLVVLTWYALCRALRLNTALSYVAAVAMQVILAYVHAIEFFFVIFITLAALGYAYPQLMRPNVGKTLLRFMLSQCAAGLFMLPLAGSALLRASEALAPSSFIEMVITIGTLISGLGSNRSVLMVSIGLCCFCILIGVALSCRETRWMTLFVPIGALAVAILLSMLFKPMIKQPVFASNILPILILAAAGASNHLHRRGMFILFATIGALACSVIPFSQVQVPSGAYRSAAEYLAGKAKAGDVVVIPKSSVYWGIVRYAVQTNWGEPLAILPAPNAQWKSLTEKLGPELSRRLHLIPKNEAVWNNGIAYVIGNDALAETRQGTRLWVVQDARYVEKIETANYYSRRSIDWFGNKEISVESFIPDPQGNRQIVHPLSFR